MEYIIPTLTMQTRPWRHQGSCISGDVMAVIIIGNEIAMTFGTLPVKGGVSGMVRTSCMAHNTISFHGEIRAMATQACVSAAIAPSVRSHTTCGGGQEHHWSDKHGNRLHCKVRFGIHHTDVLTTGGLEPSGSGGWGY